MILLAFALAAAAAPAPQRLPPDVRRFIDKRDTCEHWIGEEGYDAARQREINRNVRQSCTGVDRELIVRAKRVVGLETFASQYGVFDALSPEEQADLLMSQAVDSAGAEEDKQLVAWLTGDIAALQRDSSAGVLGDPELREALQTRRNEAWIGPIVRLLAAHQQPFVAVGEGHMFGDESLPDLLKARGYTVKRVQ